MLTSLFTTAVALFLVTLLATKKPQGAIQFRKAQSQEPIQGQIQEYEAAGPKTIVELQPFRQAASVRIEKGGKEGTATLINLNPSINVWYLLKIGGVDRKLERVFHLENPEPHTRKLALDARNPSSLAVIEGARRYSCDSFSSDTLERARTSSAIFSPLCDGRIYLRNSATGHRTTLESTTEFLRQHVWGGERIVALGHILMGEAHREIGEIETPVQVPAGVKVSGGQRDSPIRALPIPALIDPKFEGDLLKSGNLGIDLGGPQQKGMTPGAWYPARGNPGIYVSILQPNLINTTIASSYQSAVNRLDSIEESSLCYLIAFDLDRFDLGFALGTDHPRVEWSGRILDRMKDPALPGPDGIRTISPLVATGLVSPDKSGRTVATFTGGFKRTHGAFKYGELAQMNHGSHYGFIENGVVLSKLQPGLSTLLTFEDGGVEMRTWTNADNKRLAQVRYARQNGVPLIDTDPATGKPIPGTLVRSWGPGNWSGSEDGRLRTMRSGAALQTRDQKRFLIYAVFSDATPSAMVRIFQAYRCDYAMLLDMNALEHTYLALYRRSGSQMFVDHLLKGMSVLDKSVAGEIIPRFLGFADNRDFFYVLRRDGKETTP